MYSQPVSSPLAMVDLERTPDPMPTPNSGEATCKDDDTSDPEYNLRKQLLLLAMLVVSMTYVAGLNPPGGVRQEDDGPAGVKAGDPILRSTHHIRYHGFYYCNTASLAASLVVIFLIIKKWKSQIWLKHITVLRIVMVLDLFELLGAYLAGSCRETIQTVYASSLVLGISAYVGVHVLHDWDKKQKVTNAGTDDAKERRKVVLLLATFTTAISYVAGLNPPGGFWDKPSSSGGGKGYRLGDSLVDKYHQGHYSMFFYSNTTTFVMSLFTVVLLLGKKLSKLSRCFALLVFVFSSLLGLTASYAAGSCRNTLCTVSVVTIFGLAMAFIFLTMMVLKILIKGETPPPTPTPTPTPDEEASKEVKSLVLLLADLVATITYQAGLGPPGGFWQDNHRDGHIMAGDSILMSKHPMRYKAFFFCNSIAFVMSLLAILMVQNGKLSHPLLLAMVLDMLALIGAYAAGSCRDTTTTVIVLAMAVSVLTFVLLFTLQVYVPMADGEQDKELKKKRKRLLLLAILVATITYQVGLAPPAGFRIDDDQQHHAGDAVLLYSYPQRYNVFFYCNTASFMSSIALILLLANPKLTKHSERWYWLYTCQVAGLLLGLIGAYVGGSAQGVRASLPILVSVSIAVAVTASILMVVKSRRRTDAPPEAPAGHQQKTTSAKETEYSKRKYLMMLGILAASVTYQAGMAPPGGLWQEDGGRRQAGNPVLHDTDPRRYTVFFYSNSISFVASILVITLLLQQILRTDSNEEKLKGLLLRATNAFVVVDLLALLAAYAAGSTREWENVVGLALLVGLLLITIPAVIWFFPKNHGGQQPS